MLHKSHKLPALVLSGAMLLSLNSCGLMEMRDSYVETEEAEETTGQMLAPAERVNQVIERPVEEENQPETPEVKECTVALSGDVLVDTGILKDAADGAYDGQSYSFLTMYTGIYGNVSTADAAMMSYSTADRLADRGEQAPPVESLAALSDLGADILDTTGCKNMESSLVKHGILNINGADGGVETVEKNGVILAFTAISAENALDDIVLEEVQYAALVSDAAVVSVTWGENTTADEMNGTVWALAAAGADVIVGKGAGLGAVEWLDTGDGSKTLTAYSLGNILSTSSKTADLLGGILRFTVKPGNGGAVIEDVVLEPTFTHYTAEYRDYQVFRAANYSDELAAEHSNSGVYTSVLEDIVRGTVPEEFLPAALRG